jgi:transcriptional regulator with XRE-family HTH domain
VTMAVGTPERGEPVEVKKRRLRTTLRNLRSGAGLTQKQAATKLYWSVSKVVRIEQGTVPVTPSDVTVMLLAYGVSNQEFADELVSQAADVRVDKGWASFSDVLSEPAIELIGSEAAAHDIYAYEPAVVPGLLQTYDYAEALLRALGNSEQQVQRKLDVRTQRQLMLDATPRPTLNYILGEAALARPVGGNDAMVEQFSHLLELSQRDDINLWLLPFSSGPHRGMGSAFTVMQFNDPELPDLLYLENAERESISRDQEGDIKRYLDLFVELQKMADKAGGLAEQVERIRRERFTLPRVVDEHQDAH